MPFLPRLFPGWNPSLHEPFTKARSSALTLICLPNAFPGCGVPLAKTSPRFSKVRSECQSCKTQWLYTALELGHLAGLSGCPQPHHNVRDQERHENWDFNPAISPMMGNPRGQLVRFPFLLTRLQVCTETIQERKAVYFWENPIAEVKPWIFTKHSDSANKI